MNDKDIERGAASINIELSDGTITVRHGETNNVLQEYEGVPLGSWSRLWETLESFRNLSEQEEIAAGEELAELLSLKKKRSNGRYDTTWGDKTALGLYRTIKRFIEDKERRV